MTNLSIKLYTLLTNLVRREEGQDLVEYAVLVGAIGIVAGAILFALVPGIIDTMANAVADCLQFDEAGCTNALVP